MQQIEMSVWFTKYDPDNKNLTDPDRAFKHYNNHLFDLESSDVDQLDNKLKEQGFVEAPGWNDSSVLYHEDWDMLLMIDYMDELVPETLEDVIKKLRPKAECKPTNLDSIERPTRFAE